MPSFLQDHLAAIIIFLVLVMISSSLSLSANLPVSASFSSSSATNNSYNVMTYGAIGDGTNVVFGWGEWNGMMKLKESNGSWREDLNVIPFHSIHPNQTQPKDDSQAFMKAWKAACQDESFDSTLIIPDNRTFLLKPLRFSGPCKSSNIYLKLSGNIVAPNNKLEWTGYHINAWLTFSYVNGLVITGNGQIDGQGSAWWSQPCLHDLHTGRSCKGPSALVFHSCNGLRLSGLTHRNSPRVHIILTNCYDAIISNLRITAPETSPNTDGINISGSKNVTVKNSYIGTGDDCIAVSGGSSFVNITGISCGPGHGISIGALGKGGHDEVEEIHVRNCTLTGTLTGVRVKSWQGGSGYARKISFENIKLIDVNNPIIIDQFYCPSRANCQNSVRTMKSSAVELSDIRYKSIVGTSRTDQVINLSCSRSHGCTNIRIERVYIKSTTPGKRVNANCINAHGTCSHTIPDVKCLLP